MPQLFLTALDRLGEGRTLVVGDRVDSDLAAAKAAGLDAALVAADPAAALPSTASSRTRWRSRRACRRS